MTPTPDDFPTFSKLFDWAWAGVLLLGGMVSKAHNARMKAAEDEIARQRDNVSKLFDKLESHAQRSEDRHNELMTLLHHGLAGKADK